MNHAGDGILSPRPGHTKTEGLQAAGLCEPLVLERPSSSSDFQVVGRKVVSLHLPVLQLPCVSHGAVREPATQSEGFMKQCVQSTVSV